MSPENTQFVPLILVTPLLAAMALHDLKYLKIANRLILAMLVVFVLSVPFYLSTQEVSYRVLAGLATFALGVLGFALRLWGGGDVKAIAVLVLFVPSYSLLPFAYTFSASMAVGMALVLTTRATLGYADNRWASLRPKAGYPMGVSIALAGVLLPLTSLIFAK